MIDVYVLDKNLQLAGIVDAYKSLIWAKRYNEIGDCELYLDASMEYIDLLKDGYYLIRSDDDMVCQIRKIEIDTSAINGNFLIVTAVDTKAFLDMRIVWKMSTCTGKVESFIRNLITASCISPSISARTLKKANGNMLLYLGAKANFPEVTNEQVTYKNVGEKIREYCKTYQWGYKFIRNNNNTLSFVLYKGQDLSDKVIFSEKFENLASTKYVDDKSNMGNVALVGGAGEGSERATSVYGAAASLERYEKFIDAKDINKIITWEELTAIYPLIADGGEGYLDGVNYRVRTIDIQVYTAAQLSWLQTNYSTGQLVTVDGQEYWRVENIRVAAVGSSTPDNSTPCTLLTVVYMMYLLARGCEKLADYGESVAFEGSVIPDVTFVYKEDYNLGDIVTVENEFGITANARIVEVVEVVDDTGYSVQPKFEYTEVL